MSWSSVIPNVFIGALLLLWVLATAEAPVPTIELVPVITTGLMKPVYAAVPPDGSGQIFIVEQRGRIRVVKDGRLLPRPFIDLTGMVRSSGMEQGLLGMAFHPGYRENRRYFVQYTREPDGAIVVAESKASDDPDVSSPTQEVRMIVPHPFTNHNAGMIEFGPDGLLYIGMGDGGSRGDPSNRGQNVQDLLGKILRVEAGGGAFGIPSSNPFAHGGGRPEIYAWGLRNPWRFSFDRETGDLWVADVGQNDWEEIDVVERGRNYGWRVMEGRHCFSPKTGCETKGLMLPLAEYPTRAPRCAITGGYVYRGTQSPRLRGWYLFGDYCSGEIMGLSPEERETVHVLARTGLSVASFGQDRDGELFVIDLGGGVYSLQSR